LAFASTSAPENVIRQKPDEKIPFENVGRGQILDDAVEQDQIKRPPRYWTTALVTRT
jgi:hypothetical protein